VRERNRRRCWGWSFCFHQREALAGHGLHTTRQERPLVLVVSLNVAILSATRFQYPQLQPHPQFGAAFFVVTFDLLRAMRLPLRRIEQCGIDETAKPATGDAIAAAAAVTHKAAGLL
jgi:hypothetical protein